MPFSTATSDLEELVFHQSEQDLTPTDLPSIATDDEGVQAFVPEGEKWLVHSIELINTSSSSVTAKVWTPPQDECINLTEVRWLRVPEVTIPANSSLSKCSGNVISGVLWVLKPNTSIWLLGGGTSVNLVVLGWRIKTDVV